ncbi:hypothetical protein MHYP_G00027120 [Metynnis hypsauchen]
MGGSTTYISKAARVDMITLHARGWNERKTRNLHKYLSTDKLDTPTNIIACKLCWAIDTPDDPRTDDPVGLQHVIEGLFLGIQQKKRGTYIDTEPVDSVEDLLATESSIWPWDSEHDASIGIKKKVFDKVMQLERLIKEEVILVEEMRQHWNHLTKTCRALRDQAGVLSDDLATQSYPSGLSG